MISKVFEAYVVAARPPHRKALRQLFDAISSTVPAGEHVTRRGLPAILYLGRTVASIGDAERHVALYIMQGHAITRHAAELAGYDFTRVVVRFDPRQIPVELVSRLVRTRMEEIEKQERPPSDGASKAR